MTHSGPSITSTQQILPCALCSGPLLARTRNFADVIAMAPGAASKYLIGKWMPDGGLPIVYELKRNHIRDQYMPGACVGRFISISCCGTDPVAMPFVNGGYLQILVGMFNIGALRCSRRCHRSTSPRARPHVSAPRAFVHRGILDGLRFFVCCSCLLGFYSSGLISGVLFSGAWPCITNIC